MPRAPLQLPGGDPLDLVDHLVAQVLGRHECGAVPRRLREAGEVVEEVGDVVHHLLAAREQPDVGVEPCRGGVVVAGADVGVAAQAVALASHHQTQLGVGLEPGQAVHHVHAGTLEGLGPADVALLVEPGLQLHQAHGALAALGRADERGHDGRVARRAVERLLDGHHVGILRRLAHEPRHAGLERVVRVVHQDVAAADLVEDAHLVAAIQQARGLTRLPRRVLQVGAVDAHHLPQAREVKQCRDRIDVRILDAETRLDLLEQRLAAACLHLKAHRAAEAAATELALHRVQQVVGLVADAEVGVARDAEEHAAADLHAREEVVEVGRDDLLHRHQGISRAHQPGNHLRHLDAREPRLAGARVVHVEPQVERQAADVREGQPGTDGERDEHGCHLALEAPVEIGPVLGRQVLQIGHHDALAHQLGTHGVAPAGGLALDEFEHPLTDARHHLFARQLVGRARRASGLDGIQHAGHAHHEELVEVAREDGQELRALEQRLRLVLGQLEYARVEVEP